MIFVLFLLLTHNSFGGGGAVEKRGKEGEGENKKEKKIRKTRLPTSVVRAYIRKWTGRLYSRRGYYVKYHAKYETKAGDGLSQLLSCCICLKDQNEFNDNRVEKKHDYVVG